MKKTLRKISELSEEGIIEKYAIAGGMAHFYYIEPSVTYDLDLIVQVPENKNILNPLEIIYTWAKQNNLQFDGEHIIIEGVPVQFLLAYNDLVSEALINAVEIKLFDEKTYILKAEYLMAIMLQTGRMVDKERFVRFISDAEYDKLLLQSLLAQHKLIDTFKKITNEL